MSLPFGGLRVGSRGREAFWGLGLFLSCVLLYLPSLFNGFLLDDLFYISRNPALLDPGQWPRFLYDPASLLSEESLSRLIWRPVLGLSYGLNALLAGPDPFWFHLHDSLNHAANSVLVLLLLRRLAGPGPHAWAGALLFCCHPVQAQSVAYAGARAGLLSLFFCLGAFLLYAGPADDRRPLGLRPRPRRFASSLGCFALALLSKESSLFLVPVLAAFEWVERPAPEARGESTGPAWRRLAPFIAAGALYLGARTAVLGIVSQRGPWGGGWMEHFQLAVHGLFKTASLVVWPVDLREPYGFLMGPWFLPESVAMAGILLSAACLAVWGVRRRSRMGFALFWVFSALLPVSNIVPFGALAADRYLYAPMAGAALLLGLGLKGRLDGRAKAAAALLAAVMALAAVEAQLKWRSGFVLACEACAAAPDDPYPALRLATHYLEWRMLARAEGLTLRGFAPEAPPDVRRLALKRLAVIRMSAGRFREAKALLEESLGMDPRQRSVLDLLARCSLALGDPAASREYFVRAAALP
ncbi:MAG: hypothetical protein HY748_10150 [Elusimicrobia bacterium]|nr:hypothetical protein [Elusimicrobiota bacterium]